MVLKNKTETVEVKRSPIDFESLEKGDIIPATQMEEMFGETQGTDPYDFKLLAFYEELRRELDALGQHWTIAVVKGDMRILLDEQAVGHNEKGYTQGRGKMHEKHRLGQAVDRTKLLPETCKHHDRMQKRQTTELLGQELGRRNKLPKLVATQKVLAEV